MSYSDEWPAPEDKPFVFRIDIETNGIHGLETVPLSDYTYLKEWQERAIKHTEELTSWNEAGQEAMVQLVKMPQTADAERDRAIRQRDHAREMAELLKDCQYGSVAGITPDPDDGWVP